MAAKPSWATSRRTPLQFQRTSPRFRLRRSPTHACCRWKSSTPRKRRSFRQSPSRIRERRSSPQHRADAGEPALRSQDPFRRPLSVAGGVRQKTLPDAWRRAGFRRAEAEPKRPEARRIYETSYTRAEPGPGVAKAVAKAAARPGVARANLRILINLGSKRPKARSSAAVPAYRTPGSPTRWSMFADEPLANRSSSIYIVSTWG
jgi:hypothetical protein